VLGANELFEQYQNYATALAHTFARRLGSRRVRTEDIVQWGLAGLFEAAQRFNPEGTVTFETFAYYRVRGAIYDELRKLSMTPRSARRKAAQMRGQDEYLQNEVPDFDPRLSDGEQTVRVREAIRGLGAVFLASQLASEDGEDPLDRIAEPESDEEPIDRELLEKVKRAVATLPERQRRVLEEFYVKGRSMSELAVELGVNKATISREHSRAVEKLREAVGAT
jgi:RNA polymerase sigma factor for flagellar operon FliA